MSVSRASRLKDEGNLLFQRRQLDGAAHAYACALKALEQERADHDLMLFAVISSNQSACYFEMGNFHQAAVSASSCIDYLDDLLRQQHKFEGTLAHTPCLSPADEAKAVQMRDTNQWRRTRALLYKHDGCLHQAQKCLDNLEKREEKEDDIDSFQLQMPKSTATTTTATTTTTTSSDSDSPPFVPPRVQLLPRK